MESFKVNDITFYLEKNCVLRQKEIEEVLNIIDSSRYDGLDLEIYIYEKGFLQHFKIIYKKKGVLQLLKSLLKNDLVKEYSSYDNCCKNKTCINISIYRHRKLCRRQVKHAIENFSETIENEKIEQFTNKFLKFEIVCRLILLLELEIVLGQRKTNISDGPTDMIIENEVVLDGIMIIFKYLKEILKAINCTDVEVYIRALEK